MMLARICLGDGTVVRNHQRFAICAKKSIKGIRYVSLEKTGVKGGKVGG